MKPLGVYINKLDDDGKLRIKWKNKIVNAKKEGLNCCLTFQEYCYLVDKANLKSSNLGFNGDKYVLARYNDKGDYTIDNCRFITQKENSLEKVKSDKSIIASQNNIKKVIIQNSLLTFDERSNRIKNGLEKSQKVQKRKLESKIKLEEKRKLLNPSYCGSNNSQYGTYWLTNGINNIKWSNNKGPIPEGYRRGRI